MASTSIPIHSVQTISGNQARVRRIIEEATQDFLPGTPVQIASGDGGVEVWNGTTIAFGIAGFSLEAASGLTTTGVPETENYGTVQNQPSAVNIPMGAPLNDGRVGFETADQDTVFYGNVGPSQMALATDIGVKYGLTLDTGNNYWYVDKTKTTVGTNTVCTVTKLAPSSVGGYPLSQPPANPRGVYFTIDAANAQLIG